MSKKEKKAKRQKKERTLIKDFKAFISRGNVLDLAVGVIMGSAFGAIVSSFTNILLSVCTWGVPGGINGLVTVLPALTEAQRVPQNITVGGEGLEQSYSAAAWAKLSQAEGFNTTIAGMYTLHGNTYYYNKMALIDWGAFINAIITFLIIAITLFTILKITKFLKKKSEEAKALALEEYYKKHPEEKPVPAPEAPKEPTDHDILKEMLEIMKYNKEASKPQEIESK